MPQRLLGAVCGESRTYSSEGEVHHSNVDIDSTVAADEVRLAIPALRYLGKARKQSENFTRLEGGDRPFSLSGNIVRFFI